MPDDAERFRFIADHKLTLHTDGGDYLVHWVRSGGLLSLGNPIPGRHRATLVHIVTREGLTEFVKSLDELFVRLQEESKERYDKLMRTWERIQRARDSVAEARAGTS
jgi:hypothetical protein